MILPYRRYAEFDGRSRRMEFWMFTLFYYIVFFALFILMFAGLPWTEIMAAENGQPIVSPPGPLFWFGFAVLMLFSLGSFVPMIAVTVRRFHDQDMSGWFYLLNLVPLGGLIVLVFMFLEGTKGPNQYGDDPKGAGAAGIFE